MWERVRGSGVQGLIRLGKRCPTWRRRLLDCKSGPGKGDVQASEWRDESEESIHPGEIAASQGLARINDASLYRAFMELAFLLTILETISVYRISVYSHSVGVLMKSSSPKCQA
jgi:hypothetical protein